MWKWVRVTLLLLVLLKVMQQSYAENMAMQWHKKLYVAVYPINGASEPNARKEVNAHIQSLHEDDFQKITEYFSLQAANYDIGLKRPFEVVLGDTITFSPPAPPESDNPVAVMFWSLGLRAYAAVMTPDTTVEPDIKMYLVYRDPNTTQDLGISTALEKGRLGRINVFADRSYHQKNLVVIAHELLHTVKATDKYNLDTNQPNFPEGYAQPKKKPLYPQDMTELMGGRTPITHEHAMMPDSLDETIIGQMTAKEIGWLKG